jgi:bacterioferritin-associated ferredoxin
VRSIRIDRCVCYGRTFTELREVADVAGVRTLEELKRHASFGANCGLCHPYVRRMLRTGEVVFSELLGSSDE